MSRILRDTDLRLWEAYASTGAFGRTRPCSIVFRCVSDAGERPRTSDFVGDKAEAEAMLQTAGDAELMDLLESAADIV